MTMTVFKTKATTLVLGSGRKSYPDSAVTLDCDPQLNPHVLCTLGMDSIPYPDNTFETAVAIHVLEHIGRQGDTAEWFYFWEELYRVLKPGGQLQFESPMWSSPWCWADPGHTRAIAPESFAFLRQDNYRIKDSSITPYRVRCDFRLATYRIDDGNIRGILDVQKPLRPWWEDAK